MCIGLDSDWSVYQISPSHPQLFIICVSSLYTLMCLLLTSCNNECTHNTLCLATSNTYKYVQASFGLNIMKLSIAWVYIEEMCLMKGYRDITWEIWRFFLVAFRGAYINETIPIRQIKLTQNFRMYYLKIS